MKPTISLESEAYAVSKQASPLFSSPMGQPQMAAATNQSNPLLEIEFPLFEEATQTAARFLDIPVSFVGISAPDSLILKAAVGLSQLGLMNPLARTRRLSLQDNLVKAILSSQRSLVLADISEGSEYATSCLVSEYGIRSYLGIPLLTAKGECIGILAAMDTQPRTFSPEAIAFMELLARWGVSEYERHQLELTLANAAVAKSASLVAQASVNDDSLLDTVRLTLMSQLTQDMRNPLTTITGMANMLSREIYGSLTPKQREYADIVHTSSQYLLNLANEVLELSGMDARMQPLQPTSVDIDMVGQHVERMLEPLLNEKNQEIRMTVEPGSRLWTLDRDVVRYLMYHLLFSIVRLSGEGGTLQIHSAERNKSLNMSVKLSHPWLGDGLPQSVVSLYERLTHPDDEVDLLMHLLARVTGRNDTIPQSQESPREFQTSPEILQSRETLALLLSRHLIERHGGSLDLQGSAELGYRFLIVLPFLQESAE